MIFNSGIVPQLSGKNPVRITSGSYVGTGTGGSTYPNTGVECDFYPELLILYEATGAQQHVIPRGAAMDSAGVGSMSIFFEWGESGVSWRSQDLSKDSAGYMAQAQCNKLNATYYYVIIGRDA